MLETITSAVVNLISVGVLAVFDYISLHVLFCLIPAFFLAGAISALFSKESVLKFLGPDANKVLSYGVAAVSGVLLAVCSCTVLPLFTGIYKRGAGIGPACTFLFSAPAINVLAIIYSAQKLGIDLGIARAIGAVSLSIVIGVVMTFFYQKSMDKESKSKKTAPFIVTSQDGGNVNALRTPVTFILLTALLILGAWSFDWLYKGPVLVGLVALITIVSFKFYSRDELKMWMSETWFLVKKIFPLLIGGVFFGAMIIYLIPLSIIETFLGGNGILSVAVASVSGALMYFSTLTEVPIVGLLMQQGMGKGPALAMLLAGPALSLPSMLVILNIMGKKKGFSYIGLVILMAIICGLIFGAIV